MKHPELTQNIVVENESAISKITLIKAYRVFYPEAGLLESKTAVEFMLEKEK
jgi:ribosomal protein L7/L12